MYAEDDLLPLSALQHLLFCERQCGLIHIEQLWQDNVLTVEGTHLHQNVDEEGRRSETREDVITVRRLSMRSLALGLIGKADVVEFHADAAGVALPGRPGRWRPFPVEYKRGRPKRNHCDEVQLCAQALCLEEYLGVVIPGGALFYGQTQHRFDVAFQAALREETYTAAKRLHALIESGITPLADEAPKCENCSLRPLCLPRAGPKWAHAADYFQRAVETARRDA